MLKNPTLTNPTVVNTVNTFQDERADDEPAMGNHDLKEQGVSREQLSKLKKSTSKPGIMDIIANKNNIALGMVRKDDKNNKTSTFKQRHFTEFQDSADLLKIMAG